PSLGVRDTGDDGKDTTGLHYYRDGLPSYYKLAPAGNVDSMDTNCTTLPPNSKTSLPTAWVDPRGIDNPAQFYSPASTPPTQNKMRVTIRAWWDLNQMQY